MRSWIRSTLGLCIAVLLCALMAAPSAVAQIAGTNVNMVSGTQWPGGDPFLQRQNEPSIAVSSRNPFHLLAGANDYRTVDLALTTNGETGDAWLGLFKSLDGGATWRSTLLPGCPYNTSICAGAPAVKNAGYQAAADPTVRAGTNGMFYYAGLVFNRGLNPASAIIVSRLIDLNNKENADPNDILNGDSIQYIGTSILATGTSSQFLDKPTMAVDIPRFGATTCNLTVNQPGNGVVHQSFAAGNVYVAYTAFSEAPNTDPETATGPQLSKLYFVRSTNCGASWSTPVMISGNTAINQGASIAIDPMTGIVYVAWREFHYRSGTTNQPDAIVVAGSINGGKTFLPPLRISTFTPFDEGTTNTSFRTNAYPSIAVDNRSRVYVAYSARNTVPSGDARIVLTNALFGLIWSAPTVVDSPSVDPNNNPSGRGHQIMPTLTFAGGKLSLLYYDLRLDHTVNTYAPLFILGQPTGLYTLFPKLAGELGLTPPQAGAVFNQYIDDSTITIRRHTFDLRMAQASPGKLPVFAPSVLVSQYAYGCCATNQTDIEQLEFNAPNLPIFRSGTAPFMGDYVDLAAGPSFLPPTAAVVGNDDDSDAADGDGDADDWRYNLSSSNPTIFHAAWTDNRDVQAPADGNWTHYTPPNSPSRGSTSIFQPGTSVPSCQVGFTGSRNQNIYTAPISNGLVFGAPGNTKQLGTTVFNGQTFPFQRAFAVVTQNTTSLIKSFRMTIANQPPGGNASFLQFAQLTSLDLSIPPLSSASRPVFVTSTNPTASVTVNIAEITAPQGTLVPNGLSSSTTLNPDPTNPTITNPTISNPTISNPTISNFEVTNPTISNPTITNPTISNPTITNPTISNPTISNAPFQSVSVVNPTITNPTISNPTISNASIVNPTISNPTISNLNPANTSISDTQWAVSNTGNTTGSFTINLASSSPVPLGNVLQLIISKLYQTPAAPTGQDCNLKVETHNQIVTNIVNPTLLNPTDPTISNPTITNPTISNATVALDPGETANVIIRVVNTNTQTFPTFNPSASVTPVVVSQAVPTQTVLSSGGGTPPPPPITVPPLQITTTSLPDAVTGLLYVVAIQTVGGNPTAHTFSVTAGALPTGLTLDPVTGAIAGVVQASGTATFSFQVRVQDVGSPSFPQHTTTQNLSIRVGSALVFAPTTLAQATQGTSYSQTITVTGGLGTVGLSLVGGSLPPGLTLNALSGLISGIPTASGPFSFTVQATDSASPPQMVSQSYTINVVSVVQVPANVTFVTQPGNSVGGQILTGSPVIVQVTDNTGAAIPGANVTMTFSPPPPCSAATLSGTLTQPTNAQGQATFSDLSVDRGQLGYTLLAISANATAVSNPFTVNGFCATSSLSTPRELHTEVLLGNGKVLIAGGTNTSGNVLNTAEIYDPVAGTVSSTGNLTAPNGRAANASVLLPNGQVLLVGGSDSTGNPLAIAELYDPTSGTFSATGSMAQARNPVSAVLLANGKVLVSGGVNATGALNSAEVYDPATGSFILTGNMNQARARHTMTLLSNGTVLIAGGRSFGGPPITVFASAEIFDPTANGGVGAFTSMGTMNSPRDEGRATLLPNGTVLITGGFVSYQTNLSASSAETFDPATGVFTLVGGMSTSRAHQTSSLLPDGTVLVAGGVPDTGATTPATTSAEIFNPATGTFSLTGALTLGREFAQPVVLLTGNPLVSGGDDGVTTTSNQEIYYSTAPLAPLTITTTSLPNGSTGQPYTQILLEQGGVGNLTWTETGSLPVGMTFSNQGVLSGTPTVAGSFSLTTTVTDSSTPAKSTSSNFTLSVANTPLVFTSSTVPTAVVGRPYIQALPVAGGTQPYNATVTSGTLPPGLLLSNGGVLNGTPSGTGSFTFTVTVTDSSTPTKTATQTLTMGVNTLVITTTVLPNGIVGVPYNAPINTGGGALPLSFSLTTAAFPPGLLIQQPPPSSSSGALAGTPTLAGTYTFSESVVDSSNPQQTATQNYVVTIAPAGSAVPANVTFVSQRQNSVGGQILSGGPVVVQVTDANNAPIPGTTVAMSLSGIFNTPLPCSVATLSGALTAVTNAAGQATFSNLSIDRGGFNYALMASTGSASGSSGPFSVKGFCASGNLSTPREGHTQDLLGTAQSTIKLPVDPRGTYLFTGPGDAPNPPLIVSLASLGIKPGDAISGVSVGDENACGVGQFCFGELFTPFACGVFSSSNTLLPTGGAINRVPGAIAPNFTTAFPCNTAPTAGGNLPTDIPQDFGLFGERVTVPAGAAYLFVAVADIFYADNNDPNGDFGVAITKNTASSVNGKVLIAGGSDNLGNALNTAELYDPAFGSTSPTGNLSDPNGRANHVSVVLPNGKVLLIGGFSNVSNLATAELYDPATGTFTPTGSMSQPRGLPAAVLLADGRVLVSGGFNTLVASNTAEIYDPATGVFTPTGNMTQGRGRHQMTLLPNGKVLVTGGRDAQQNFFALSSAEIFDPFANQGAGAFTAIGYMNSPRFKHTATLLSNGTVLIAGGFNGDDTSSSVASAEIFDPNTNAFTPTGSMNTPRARHTSTLLPDGTVLEAGSINGFNGVIAAAPAELYSPTSGTFTSAGGLITGRELPEATLLLPNGNVLLSGGDDGVNVLASTEVYFNPVAQTPVVITTTSVPNGFISQPYVQLLLERGSSGPLTWSLASGTLPPGITLGANGILSGTPTAVGSFTFTVQVTDGISTTAVPFTINVSLPTLTFTSNIMPAAGAGKPYSQPLPVTGGTQPYNVTVTSGTLPPGLALGGAGILSGTPSSAGSFTFTVSVTDSSAPAQSATQTLTIAVNTLSITTTALPSGMVGVPYNAAISTSGGTLPLTFSSATAAFPPGLTIQQPAANSHSGALAGTPTLAGHYTFTESVMDSSTPAQTATQSYVMDIFAAGTTAVPATVTFISQPQNSVGGQILAGTPIRVHVADANNVPITGASVAISFNGAPPCSSAVLSGTLNGITNGSGNAVFFDLSIDRGQLGYTLLASAGSASAVSQPFTVNGFCPTNGPISIPRQNHTAVTLANGTVLIAGGGSRLAGVSSPGLPFSSTELYDPSTGTFSAAGNMNVPRWGHTATLLRDGRVLVTGGVNSPSSALGSITNTAEIYDPSTHTFTPTVGVMNSARFLHTATLLADGRVMVVGGGTTVSAACILCFANSLTNTAEIFDPATGLFTPTSNTLATARQLFTATLLPNGQVLIAGGFSLANSLASAEIFDPVANAFHATANMTEARVFPIAALLTNGKVLIAGPSQTAELYDPATDTFTPTGNLAVAGGAFSAAVLTDGTVFLVGGKGQGPNDFKNSSEIYNPSTGAFALTGSLVSPDILDGLALLQDGTVLTTGGENSAGTIADAEVYYSTAPLAPLQIATPSALPAATLGQPYTQILLEQGGVGPLTWTLASGTLPPGIRLRPDGVLIGTPTAGGTFTFTVNLVDSSNPQKNTTSGTFSLMVTAPITPLDFPAQVLNTGITGVAYSTSGLTASGGTSPYNFAVTSGTPPTGITLAANGQFSGMPTGVGSSTFTVTVTDSSPPQQTASQSLTIQVVNPLAFTTTTLPNGTAGTPYPASAISTTGGTPPVAFIVSAGTFPAGLSLASNGSISGTPTSASTFTFTISASDASTPAQTASQTYTVTIAPAAAVPAQVMFVRQPEDSIGGQTLSPSPSWTQLAPAGTLPAGRYGLGSAFDATSNSLMIFGGGIIGGNLNDFWVLNNASGLDGTPRWNNLIPNGAPGSPPAAHYQSAVYDGASNRLITFGGCLGGCFPTTNSIWVLTNANGLGGAPTWIQLSTAGTSPAARVRHTAVYDSATNSMIIFAGQNGSGNGCSTFSDVWVLSHANGLGGTPTWTHLSPSGGPPSGQYGATAVYDPATNRMTVFGGLGIIGGTCQYSNAVWTLTNANGNGGTPVWTNLIAEGAPGAPAARGFHTAVYNPAGNRMTIFGGSSLTGDFGDTWILSSVNGIVGQATWMQSAVAPGPSARGDHAAIFDPTSGRMTIFGGGSGGIVVNDTWVLNRANQAGGPVQIRVTDNTNTPIQNASVSIGFNGTPPCAAATLGGTLTQTTDATGTATFGNLTINRGQFAYTLAATAGSISAISNPFNVEGFCDTGSLDTPRRFHTTTLLSNGKVLIAGGEDSSNAVLASALVYDPGTGVFTSTGAMATPRWFHSATLLPNGKVLIAGGITTGGTDLNSAELFDPTTAVFAPTGSMNVARAGHTATQLLNGEVLVAAGGTNGALAIASAELYDPATGVFALTGNMSAAREQQTATLLANGTVLFVGGADNSGNPQSTAELYDPSLGAFTLTGSMSIPRQNHAAALLPNGTVLVIGGLTATQPSFVQTGIAEIYDPVLLTFSPTGSLIFAQGGPAATLLTDGTVLATNGPDAEVYSPTAATFSLTGPSSVSHTQQPTTLLNDGTVLVAGGNSSSPKAEIYYSTSPQTPLTITLTVLPVATENQPYTQLLLEQGGVGTLTWALTANSGPLAPGLTLGSSGILSGTPTQFGSFAFTVQVTDSSVPAKTATITYTLVVNPVFQFFGTQLATALSGVPYSNPLPIIGGTPPYTATLTAGILPSGLTLANDTISGMTTALGTYTLTFQATDSSVPPQSTTGTLTLGVTTPLTITTTTLPNGALNSSYSATIATSGALGTIVIGPTANTLPPGLVMSPQGVISGTPTQTGTFNFTVVAFDQSFPPQTATQAESITITTAVAPISLSPNPMNLFANNTGNMTVTLSSAAGPNGQTVTLASSNPSVASVPASVNVLPNNTSATFQVTAGATANSATITASAPGATSGTAIVVVATTPMSLTLDGPLIAINRSFNATVTLTQPVPTGSSITVALAANPSGVVSISPATQTIQAGQTAAIFTLTAGSVGGSVVLTATASGYTDATAPLTVTSKLISFGTIPTLAPGQSGSLPVSLSFAAPPGGLTINFSSANPSIATITPSVFVPAGLLIPAANPQATGVSIGSTQITATAVGFAPDIGNVSVTVTASVSPNPISVNATTTVTETLTISAAAPAGGITFNLTSDNTAAATVPSSATVPQGQLAVGFGVTGVAQGSANLNVSSPGITTVTAPINVGPQPAISINVNGLTGIVGNNLLSNGSIGITAAPPSNETMTITSSDPTHFLLSTSPTAVGSSQITLQLTASGSVPAFYVEGQNFSGTSAITATLTASAAGYSNGTVTVSLYPTGLTYFTTSLSTTTFSSPSALPVYLVMLTPGTLNFYTYGYPLGPQAPGAVVPVAVTSTNTSVGTVTGSPASIGVGTYFTQAISFVPATAGTTNLNLAIPTGYFTPANQSVQTVATVTAPAINSISINNGTGIVGNNLLSNGSIGIAAAPPFNETMTITSNDPTHFLLSTSPTAVGSAQISLQLTAGSISVPAFYVEGQNFSGISAITATLTASAAGYSNGTVTVSLYPTGLTYFTTSLNTTTFASPSVLTVYLVILTPGTLTFYNYGFNLGPQAPAVPVAVTSTNTGVGTVTGSPASIGVGTYYTQAISFHPSTAGTTNLNLATPSGYFTPANQSVQIATTVTAPAISLSVPIVGNNLIVQGSLSLGAAPPSNETMTITSSDPTHFLLSTTPTAVGSAQITLQLTAGSGSVPAFYIEGQNFSGTIAIAATLTASAPGYSDGTFTLNLYPTGLSYLSGGTLNTTTFSTPTTLPVYLVILTPGTLTLYNYGFNLGPQAPGASAPVAVTSTNTSVGTVTGSPASISVGTYFTQAISFHPSTAGTTNLNLATPTGYSTPANVPVQAVATVTAPAINGGSLIIGNNLVVQGGLSLGAAPPSNETLTLTSSDPTHFLLSTSPNTVGSSSITLQLTAGSFSVPAFYVEGQNFSGVSAIAGTLTASAAGYSDGVVTVSLYPTGLTYFTGTLNTSTSSGPTPLTVYLVLLTPGTLTFYTYGYPLGPQAPGAVPVSVTSTNTNVGTITGSPASIGLGTYYTQAISFVPATAGITNLNLAIPAGYFTPSNQPVQIVATVQ